MNTFKNKFLTALNEEEEFEGQGINYDRPGDTTVLNNTFPTDEDARAFDAVSKKGEYDEDYSERVKEWQAKMTEFVKWINGTEKGGLRYELMQVDKKHDGITKNSEKEIGDIAKNLAALAQIIVEIPSGINHNINTTAKETQASFATNDTETSTYRF